MLIAHASSTCDVCFDNYSEGVSYHAIPCGHVFCLSCLIATNPSRCPLCRQDFSVHNMRKLHLSLPSSRDHFARMLEMKLVQTSPDMTLAESLSLFQEVQDWLGEQSDEEYLVLRAFAAVLCGFHEIKDKLSTTEHNFEQFKTEATEKEDSLQRSLEEARNTSDLHINDYKSKYREAKAELSQVATEAELLQSQLDQYKEREKQNQSTLDAVRNLYQTAKMELITLRDECTDLRSQITQFQESEQKRIAQYREYYNKMQAHIQSQVQAQVQAHTQSLVKAVEARVQTSRRQSNPLPPPPKQVEIPFVKYMAKSTAARRASYAMNELEEERRHQSRAASPNSPSKLKASSSKPRSENDQISSVFVPTLAVVYPSRRQHRDSSRTGNDSDGHAEVTTLVFKPPKRTPLWDEAQVVEPNDDDNVLSLMQTSSSSASERQSGSRPSQEGPGHISESEQSELNTALTIAPRPTQTPAPAPSPALTPAATPLPVVAAPSKANALPSYITYDEYVSYEDPPFVEKYPGWSGAGFVSPFTYNPSSAAQDAATPVRPTTEQLDRDHGVSTPTPAQQAQAQAQSPRRVSSPPVLRRDTHTQDSREARRTSRQRTQSHSHSHSNSHSHSHSQSYSQHYPQGYYEAHVVHPEGVYNDYYYYDDRHGHDHHLRQHGPPPPTVVRFRFGDHDSSGGARHVHEEPVYDQYEYDYDYTGAGHGHGYHPAYSNHVNYYRYPNSRRTVEEVES